jgi:hypothetical protein
MSAAEATDASIFTTPSEYTVLCPLQAMIVSAFSPAHEWTFLWLIVCSPATHAPGTSSQSADVHAAIATHFWLFPVSGQVGSLLLNILRFCMPDAKHSPQSPYVYVHAARAQACVALVFATPPKHVPSLL